MLKFDFSLEIVDGQGLKMTLQEEGGSGKILYLRVCDDPQNFLEDALLAATEYADRQMTTLRKTK